MTEFNGKPPLPDQEPPTNGVYARASKVWHGDITDAENVEGLQEWTPSDAKLNQFGAYEEGSLCLEVAYDVTNEKNAMGLAVAIAFDRRETVKFCTNLKSVQGVGEFSQVIQPLPHRTSDPRYTGGRRIGGHMIDVFTFLYERKNSWLFKDGDYTEITNFPVVGRSVYSLPVRIVE